MNKPRLIDANELIGCINKWYESCSPRTDLRDMVICDTLDSVLQHINDIPTAYNVESVVEQLEECSVNYCKEYCYAEDENVLYLPDAIEIVKGGGKHDD